MKALIATVAMMIVTQTAFAGAGVQITNCKSKSGKTRIEITSDDGGGIEFKITMKSKDGKRDVTKNFVNSSYLMAERDQAYLAMTKQKPVIELITNHVIAYMIVDVSPSSSYSELSLVSKPGVKFVKGQYGDQKATFLAELSGVDPRDQDFLEPIQVACQYSYTF